MGKRLNHDSCCHVEGICHPDATPAGDGLGPSDYIAALCKQLAEKGAQIEDMEREIEQLARGVSITNAADIAALKRDLQSANERIEALTREKADWCDKTWKELANATKAEDALSALQRAAREYMQHERTPWHEDEYLAGDPCKPREALMDLLK